MKKRAKTPTIIQIEAVECGAVCLGIILGYYGCFIPIEELRKECGVSRDGSKAGNILEVAKKYGLQGSIQKSTFEELKELPLPSIVFWEYRHFLVLEGFHKDTVYINDPATGPRKVQKEEFLSGYSHVVMTFKKGDGFQKKGSPQRIFWHLYERLIRIPGSVSYLLITGICLLLPGFALPAFLMAFINTFFSQYVQPWEWNFVALVFSVFLFSSSVSWIQLHFLNRLNRKLSITFSSEFLFHLLKLPISFYNQRYTGEIAYRTSLNDAVADTLSGPVMYTFINLILVVFYAFVMFLYDFAIASIGLISGMISLCTMFYIFRSRKNVYACLQQDISKSIAESIGGLQHIEMMKAKALESDFFVRWAGYFTKTMNSKQEIGKKDVMLSIIPTLFQSLTIAALLGIGSIRVIDDSLTIGKLMALQLLLINFLKPIGRFVNLSLSIQNMKVNIERLNDVLKNKPDEVYVARREKKREEKIQQLSGLVEFRNVSFSHSPYSPPVVQNVSFSIKPGQRLALVGPSGSGKTTIAKLATGLYYPTSGEILYDSLPLKEISVDLFADSVATVDQEIFLFSGTIRDNLTLWNRKIPEEVIIAAAKDAEIHEEIVMRNKGYDAFLIEGGINLSGGERQRLEIARALIYKPSILILDEATSALDSQVEELILKRIRQRDFSLIMIAHRLSTIQDCDEILVLDKGVVVQRGTHEKLKEEEGVYKSLVESEALL